MTVEVETWEPNLDDGNGNNPSLQTHQITFPGGGITLPRGFAVTAYVDGVDESAEASHILKARLVASSDGSYELDAQNEAEFTILDPPANHAPHQHRRATQRASPRATRRHSP